MKCYKTVNIGVNHVYSEGSEHLNRGRVNNYRTLIKVYNFSVNSVKQ